MLKHLAFVVTKAAIVGDSETCYQLLYHYCYHFILFYRKRCLLKHLASVVTKAAIMGDSQ